MKVYEIQDTTLRDRFPDLNDHYAHVKESMDGSHVVIVEMQEQ
ncbi:MAG: hypothetical protein CM15mV33_560 [uncultured marine virus]|nr:MAG: hypothetical protein CM15mV33_560 [uncultured marine virus]